MVLGLHHGISAQALLAQACLSTAQLFLENTTSVTVQELCWWDPALIYATPVPLRTPALNSGVQNVPTACKGWDPALRGAGATRSLVLMLKGGHGTHRRGFNPPQNHSRNHIRPTHLLSSRQLRIRKRRKSGELRVACSRCHTPRFPWC